VRVVPTGLAHLFNFTRHFRAGLSYPAATRLGVFVVLAPPLAFNGSSHAVPKTQYLWVTSTARLKAAPFQSFFDE